MKNIKDLLSSSTASGLDLREDETRVVVAGLSEHRPKNAEDVMKLILRGNANRSTGFTHANATSSRSHAVLQIHIQNTETLPGQKVRVKNATLSIIDLAGSERAAATKNSGERQIEGANINRSLLALGNCINALCGEKANHIPYR
jgi:kinesin family member 18/19